MKVPVVEALADAIMYYEGWNAHSTSYRNRNPGNLRLTGQSQAHDADGFRVFPSVVDGYQALCDDLEHKITGNTRTTINADSSLRDLFAVWAPASDGNTPVRYAAFVATWLRQTYGLEAINSSTTLFQLFNLVGEDLPHGEHDTGHPGAVS